MGSDIILRRFVAGDRTFYLVQRRVRDIEKSWEGQGNPKRWFSWEQVGDERHYLARGVKTMREAQKPIDKTCGITG